MTSSTVSVEAVQQI